MKTKHKGLEEKFSSQIYTRHQWHTEVQFTATSSADGAGLMACVAASSPGETSSSWNHVFLHQTLFLVL